jgi:psiF repeat
MTKLLRGVLAGVLFAAIAAAPTITIAATAKKKELTPQQQKMKDCGAKWGEEKKAKNVSGRKAYSAFLSTCLKG